MPSHKLQSMTGFGKGEASSRGVKVEVEIRTINHRFLDIALKLPRGYQELEGEIRSSISEELQRGRVELLVTRSAVASTDNIFNKALFDQFYSIYEQCLGAAALKQLDCRVEVVSAILSRREVLGIPDESAPTKQEAALVRSAVTQALQQLCKMREKEGATLLKDINERLARLRKAARSMQSLKLGDNERVRARVSARIKKLAPEIVADEARLAAEVVYLTDRADVTEEFVRLASHLDQFEETLRSNAPGKKLEFLVQEIGREINTIGSKVQEAALQHLVVESKVEMEKIREQIQNLC